MKTFRSAPRRSGFALVLVLGLLTLLSVLVVGFMMRATTEKAVASGYKTSAAARILSTIATSLVQGEINLATTQGSDISWTSQPGMIRTFDSSGGMQRAFKLYSAPDMILGADSGLSTSALKTSLLADLPPTTWAQTTALWTDLNAPVTGSNSINNYPIVDTGKGPGTTQQITPLGFTYTNPPGATTKQPLPMPVRWLYVLRDGTLVAPTAGSTATSVNVAGDTPSNPITGRIAFWTDDETCKVNLNTAADGTFWDTPRGATITDQNLGNYQPAQREYQRYPGHPAMTALSAILTKQAGYTDQQWSEQLYKIVPRVVGGSNSSQEGTAVASTALTPDVDRLYASLDELIFDSARSNSFNLDKKVLEQAKFFLTTHSRAPEVNLFNLPRIACWPIYKLNGTTYNTSKTTAFDRLIGTCSTVNGLPYFFQRELSTSPTNDIGIDRNAKLYSYLQYLTSKSIPGYGTKFSDKYSTDIDQIITEMFDYIRSSNIYDGNLSSGNQFTAGYNGPSTTATPLAGHGWVVPTLNTKSSKPTLGFGRFFTISEFGIGFICNATADDPDTTPADESNGSNNPTLNAVLKDNGPLVAGEKFIQAIIVYEFFSPMFGWASLAPDLQVGITGLETMSVTVTDPSGAAQTQSLGFPSNGTTDYSGVTPSNMNGGRAWGGNPSWSFSLFQKGSPARGKILADNITGAIRDYPFIGIPIKIKVANNGVGTMQFSGGSAEVTIRTGPTSASPGTIVQTLKIDLPSGTFPVPNLVLDATGTTASDAPLPTSKQDWWSFARVGSVTGYTTANPNGPARGKSTLLPPVGRLANVGEVTYNGTVAVIGSGAFFNAKYDVVRTVLPADGDYRLIATQTTVSNTVFKPHPFYTTATKMMASNLSNSNNPDAEQGNDLTGKYFSNVNYLKFDIPSNAVAADRPDVTGDFDTGLPMSVDGPYINKPDEGNIYRLQGNNANIPYFANNESQYDPGAANFSPNRIMPSPGMFGSLPTRINAGKPWQTLLFRPQTTHPSALTGPKDYLFLDLFWMPVVEPYAVSDRFSTAGKINMNYQVLPFTYINRSSGLQALFKGEKVAAVKNADYTGSGFKASAKTALPSTNTTESRYLIDSDQTLTQFQTKFDSGEVFRSAAEICDMHIVPKMNPSLTPATMPTFWTSTATVTGENMRERIYTTLYPRLTTKSNTYTVHFRTQTLKKTPTSTQGIWTEGKDVITGEYRGSTTIERFIDANNTAIPDYAGNPTTISTQPTLDKFYKWRVVENRQFAP